MQSIPYLYFDGQCEAAFKFYEQCFGGEIVDMMTYGDTPEDSSMAEQVTPELRHQIMHAYLKAGVVELMGSDSPPEHFETPQGFSVSLQLDAFSRNVLGVWFWDARRSIWYTLAGEL